MFLFEEVDSVSILRRLVVCTYEYTSLISNNKSFVLATTDYEDFTLYPL